MSVVNGQACRQPGCAGQIEDGYCDVCGHAAVKSAAAASALATSAASSATRGSGTFGRRAARRALRGRGPRR